LGLCGDITEGAIVIVCFELLDGQNILLLNDFTSFLNPIKRFAYVWIVKCQFKWLFLLCFFLGLLLITLL